MDIIFIYDMLTYNINTTYNLCKIRFGDYMGFLIV